MSCEDFFVKIDVSTDEPATEEEVREAIYQLFRKCNDMCVSHVDVAQA